MSFERKKGNTDFGHYWGGKTTLKLLHGYGMEKKKTL